MQEKQNKIIYCMNISPIRFYFISCMSSHPKEHLPSYNDFWYLFSYIGQQLQCLSKIDKQFAEADTYMDIVY